MDVWINFKNATKWQAEGIFKNFFPCKRSEPSTSSQGETAGHRERPRRKTTVPILDEDELADLAKRFAEAVPEDELSVSWAMVQEVLRLADPNPPFRSPLSRDTSSRTRPDQGKRWKR